MSSLFNGQSIEQYFRPFWDELEVTIQKIPPSEVLTLDAAKVGS